MPTGQYKRRKATGTAKNKTTAATKRRARMSRKKK